MDRRTYGLSWMDFKRIAHKKTLSSLCNVMSMSSCPTSISVSRLGSQFIQRTHYDWPKTGIYQVSWAKSFSSCFFCPVVWAQWSTFFVFHIILIYAEIMIRFWKEWWTIFMYGFYTFYSLSFFLSSVIKFKAIVFKLNISLNILRVGFKGLWKIICTQLSIYHHVTP